MAVGLTHHAVLALSRGSFGAREVWFTHEPLLSAHAYHRYFDGPVQFGKPFNAVFFNRRDLAQPIPDQDPQIYEMASSYIDTRFPATSLNLVPRVYAIATRLLASGNCPNADVASKLNMHPRTLQRRLKKQELNFAESKDKVAREGGADRERK